MTEDLAPVIERMRRHLEAAEEIYRPGAFWRQLIEVNLEMLASHGVANFKRTVSNNYYNWLVTSARDEQVRSVAAQWLRRPSLAPLMTRIEPPGLLRVSDSAEPYALSRVQLHSYRLFVGALWEYARREDRFGLTERLAEPEVGNPIRIRRRGRLISQDLANSIVELNFAARAGVVRDGAKVAELGAGYGRLAHVFTEAREVSYCIFDIPPALAVSQWYARSLLGAGRVVEFSPDHDYAAVADRLRPGVVAFFTPDQLATFPDAYFDLCQTISTLPEMPHAQADHYLALLCAKASGAVLIKQWQRWVNAADGTRFFEADYVPPAGWRLLARRQDPVQPAFFNQLWARVSAGGEGADLA